MRSALLMIALLLGLPALAWAQSTASCDSCELGIFDNIEMTQNFGTWDAVATPSKTLFVGIHYDPRSGLSGLTGIELSVEGLPAGFLPPTDTWIEPPSAVIGTDIRTPADTTATGAVGGKNLAWAQCLSDNRALGRITMISLSPVGNDQVIRVKRKYPPSNETIKRPLFTQCNGPTFTLTGVSGACYVLNPTVGCGSSVGNPPCQLTCVSIEQKTWGTIKALYR